MIYWIRRFSFKLFVIIYKNLYLSFKNKQSSRPEYAIVYFRFLKLFHHSFFYKINSHKIYFDPLRSGVGWSAYFNGHFEKKELTFCKKYIKEDSIIIDVGANVGSHSIYFSDIAKSGKIFCFEPSKHTYEYLLKNVKQIHNIIPMNVALGNTNNLLTFYECDNDVMSGLKDTGRSNVSGLNSVPCYKGDELLNSINISKVDFIKIDVEGLETEVLEGLVNLIKNSKPIIFCEIYSGTNSNLNPLKTIQFLNSIGYQTFVLTEKNILKSFENHNDNEHNYFFLPILNN